MSSHRYQTRATTSVPTVPRGKPQLIPLKTTLKEQGTSSEAQASFLKAVGMISPEVTVDTTVQVLSAEELAMLSCAMNHVFIDEGGLTDPYFTMTEWNKVTEGRKLILKEAKALIQKSSQSLVPQQEYTAWLSASEEEAPLCCCLAHSTEEFYSITSSLIEISAPLNDDSGYRLAGTLIPYILKVAGMPRMKFEPTKAGTPITVKYLLQLPGGETSMYTGWPDFQVLQSYSTVERRLGRNVLRNERVRAVGEVQSPRGNDTTSKIAAVAQAGIYTVGQFAKLRCSIPKKIATVILYKDLSAQVALATMDPTKATLEGSLGEISYQLVDSIDGYVLFEAEGLARFASVFVTTLKQTVEE